MAIAKTISCSPQTDGKKIPTQLIEYGDFKLVPTKSLHRYGLVSFLQEGTPHDTKQETQTPTQPQTLFSYNVGQPARYANGQWAHENRIKITKNSYHVTRKNPFLCIYSGELKTYTNSKIYINIIYMSIIQNRHKKKTLKFK